MSEFLFKNTFNIVDVANLMLAIAIIWKFGAWWGIGSYIIGMIISGIGYVYQSNKKS